MKKKKTRQLRKRFETNTKGTACTSNFIATFNFVFAYEFLHERHGVMIEIENAPHLFDTPFVD